MLTAITKFFADLVNGVLSLILCWYFLKAMLWFAFGIRLPRFRRRKRGESTLFRLGKHYVDRHYEFREFKHQEKLKHNRERYQMRLNSKQKSTESVKGKVVTDYLRIIK